MTSFINNQEEDLIINSASIIDRRLVLDSGASEHYTPIKEWLINYKPVQNKSILVANGHRISIEGIGEIPVITNNTEILITRVNYVPSLKTTLLSSKELVNKGWEIVFKKDIALLSSKIDTSLKVIAKWDKNAYYFTNIVIDDNKLEKVVYNTTNNDLDLIHKRLNHLSKDYLIKTLKNTKGFNSNIQELNKKDLNNCEPCIYSKSHEIISYKPLESPKEILTYFDVDIAGPFKNIGLKGERYFITFTCRSTRAIWVYSLKYRSQALDKLRELVNLIKN
jgi:hypothetical protein